MNKPASLRAAIEAALPYIKKEPDRLVMFIENGHAASSLTKPGFQYSYTLTIGLLDFVMHPDSIVIPLLQWLRVNEPMLLQNPDTSKEAISFEAEILSHHSYDLRLQIKLSEQVKVTLSGNDCTAEHLAEPQIADYPLIDRVRIYHDGELTDDSAEL